MQSPGEKMDLLAVQIESPRHIARTVKAGVTDSQPMNAAMLLLYSAHRLLRLACGCCRTPGVFDMRSFDSMIGHLLDGARNEDRQTGVSMPAALKGPLLDRDVADAMKDLSTTASSLLGADTTLNRTTREWQTVVDGLSGILKRLEPLAICMRTAAGDGRGGLHVAAGTDGFAFTRIPGYPAQGTAILFRDGTSLEEYGPATELDGHPPEPLIPWPSWRKVWETIDGLVVNLDGTLAAPLAPVSGQRALARLLAWTREEAWDTALRLARTASGEAAAEYLLLKTHESEEWRDAASIQSLLDFVSEHDQPSEQFSRYALECGVLSEAGAIQSSNYAGAADALVVRQQFESGKDRARTLLKLANIYQDRLNDRTAARLCMVRALEADPGDTDILEALLDLLSETGHGAEDTLREVLSGLTGLAATLKGGHGESSILAAVIRLAARLGDRTTSDAAAARLLDIEPDSIELLATMRDRFEDSGTLVSECRRRLEKTFNPQARGICLLQMAEGLRKTGSLSEAADCVREASALLPVTPENLEAMVTILRDASEWATLIGILKRRADMAETIEQARPELMEMADIALNRLESPVVALSALSRLDGLSDPEVDRLLFKVHSDLGLFADAASDLRRIIAAGGTADERLALARICRDRLGQPAEAAAWFKAAAPDLEGDELARVALELVDLPGVGSADPVVAATLNKGLQATDDDVLRAELLKRLGGTEDGGDSQPSGLLATHLEEALKLNPNDHECAIRLAGIYMNTDLAEKAAAVLEPPARAAAAEGKTELEGRLRMMAARAASRCFDHQTTRRHLVRVLELRPEDVEARRLLASTLLALGEADLAGELLYSLSGPDGSLTAAEAPMLRELGRSQSAKGAHAAALDSLARAWALDHDLSEDVLRELADTASAAGNREAMMSWLKRLVNNEARSPRRFTDLIRLGDAAKADGDGASALQWYRMAADEDYSKKVALHKALEVSLESGENTRAVGLLEELIEQEQDDLRKSDYHLAAAMLYKDNLGNDPAAIDHLILAVSRNPANSQAAEVLDGRLIDLGMFEELADNLQLRARHFRMSGDEKALLETLSSLGDIFESRLHNAARAAEAYEQILVVSPGDVTAMHRLAFCQARMPGAESQALDSLRKVIKADPTSVDSYRALRDLALLSNDSDLATRASTALIVLGQGDESDFHLAAKNRAAALHLKTDQIPADVFNRRVAGELDPQIARLFALLYRPILRTIPFKKPADLGLTEANRVAMEEDGLFQKMADAVAHVFDIDLPDFWHAPGTKGLKKAPFPGKAIIVGDDLVTTRRGKDLRYSLARAIISFIPGAELCGVLDAASMRLFFQASLKMVFPDYPLPQDTATAAELAPALSKHLSESELEEIRRILTGFAKTHRPVDFAAYMRAVDRIAGRAGLFMANDLEVAADRSLASDLILSDFEPEDRVVDLCSWAVSVDYSELKKLMIG